MIEGIFLVHGIARLLFDSGVSQSCVAQEFITALSIAYKVLRRPLKIISPVNKASILKWAYRCIRVTLDDMDFKVDLIVSLVLDFDVILGIHRIHIDYFANMVTFPVLGQESSTIVTQI